MTTIVNSPTPTNDSSGAGTVISIVAIIGFAIVFIYYLLPSIRNLGSTPQINIPNKIDVNVKQTK